MARVEFNAVKKCYDDVQVIEKLDLEIKPGEFMVLVGPSGCGKSTALRMIAGLEDITAGNILINDQVVNDLHPKDRDIAMVFQSYALYPHMTVRENMDFGLRIQKMDRAEIDRRVDDAARILGIEEYLQRKPRQLSGGQRQRVAVGRAIVRQPSVFLFDEPLSNLDAKLRVQMRAEITGLQRRLGTTTVYVTHDQVEAMTMGHRIAVLKDGDLQQVGTPSGTLRHAGQPLRGTVHRHAAHELPEGDRGPGRQDGKRPWFRSASVGLGAQCRGHRGRGPGHGGNPAGTPERPPR